MTITSMIELNKRKVRVCMDYENNLILYDKDIKDFNLQTGSTITEEYYQQILESLIYPRAIQKALAILKYMDRSEYELRKKLMNLEYPFEIIDKVINYVSSYGYINDERLARNYIQSNINKKSKRRIEVELQNKGIKKDLIRKIFYTVYEDNDSKEDPELNAIRLWINKMHKNMDTITPEQKHKMMASLYRKGFDIDKIKRLF